VSYDSLGRITTTKTPDDGQTTTLYDQDVRPSSACGAPGQITWIVDAAERERWFRTDALGLLAEVVEPAPYGNGSVSSPGDVDTTHHYNALGLLVAINQGPNGQQRAFKYDPLGRVTAEYLPEKNSTLDDDGTYDVVSGRWSDVFGYDDQSNLVSHVDARGIKTLYDYVHDPLNRLQHVVYDMSGFGDSANPAFPAPAVTYRYMITGDVTRPFQVLVGGYLLQEFAYNDPEGRLTSKTLTYLERSSLEIDYQYDSLSWLTTQTYPVQYGIPDAPRRTIEYSYGLGGFLADLRVDGVDYASQPQYNPAGQMTSLDVGGPGPYHTKDIYNYDPNTSLLSNQQVLQGNSKLMDLTYTLLR
jgi:YD repeat-containing protein